MKNTPENCRTLAEAACDGFDYEYLHELAVNQLEIEFAEDEAYFNKNCEDYNLSFDDVKEDEI